MNKINYQRELDQILAEITAKGEVPTLLLHSCCAPCSSYVLSYLASYFRITLYYYNPNISPKEEYQKRVQEQMRLIRELPVRYPICFEEGVYDSERFFEMAKGMEDIPEGGERCFRCYELRQREAAIAAAQGGYDYFTTTLSVSPHKNAQKLNEIDQEINAKYGRKKDSNVNIFLFEKDTITQATENAEDQESSDQGSGDVDNFVIITNSEFRKAVEEFRERLRMMNSTVEEEEEEDPFSSDDDEDPALMVEMQSYKKVKLLDEDARLSYKLMSAIVATAISEDYQTLKNQALYSIISVFLENSLFMEVMDGNNQWDCEMLAFSIKRLLRRQVFDGVARSNAVEYYNSVFSDKILSVDDLTDERLAEVLEKLKEAIPSIEEKAASLSKNKEKLIDAIRESQDALAFTKIVKVTSVNLAVLESIITSDEIAQLFDEITDRMIITNFADKFYDAFIMLSKTQATTLKGFDSAVDTNTAIAACEKYVRSKVLDDIRDHVATQPIAFEYFSLATDISANTWEPCSKLDNYVHTCNVFGVLSVIDDLDSVNRRQISSEYSKVFKDALAKIHEFADTMKYNATMNQNIFYISDVGFTKE